MSNTLTTCFHGLKPEGTACCPWQAMASTAPPTRYRIRQLIVRAVALWIALSAGLILLNKYILTTCGFHFVSTGSPATGQRRF